MIADLSSVSVCLSDLAVDRILIVNGFQLQVPGDLYRLRKGTCHYGEGVTTRVWVDAVCINERDASKQVHRDTLIEPIISKAQSKRLYVPEGTTLVMAEQVPEGKNVSSPSASCHTDRRSLTVASQK
jgi:hypothetical protein